MGHSPQQESDGSEQNFSRQRNSWNWIKKSAVALAVLSSIITAVLTHENRYAKAADVDGIKQEVRSLYQDLRLGQLSTFRRDVEREEYDLLRTSQTRALTGLETTRLITIKQEKEVVTDQISRCRKDPAQCRLP